MKAVVLLGFGGSDQLAVNVISDPVPGPGEVLLRVRACALNHLDLWIRAGLPSSKVKPPFVLGCDAAGEVVGLGPGVTDISLGTRYAVHPGRSCGACEACLTGRDSDCPDYGILGAYGGLPGAYSELLSVPVKHLLAMPREMSFIEAAAAPLTFLTAWHMLVSLAKLQPGETVLITGAGSGVATAAIQIARCLSAHVIVTSTSADKLLRAKALGAHEGILCPPDDLARSIRKMTSGRMVDVAFEHVGGEHFSSAMKSLRRSGRLVTCGATANASVMVDLRYIFDRQLQILGAKMGGLAEMRRVWELISSGHLKPVIDRTFTLDDARAAHDYLAQKSQFGKVVLTL